MEADNEKLDKFLEEGADWFKKHHFPQFFPAFVAQIPDSIKELTKSIEGQAESNKQLSISITRATWVLAGIAFLALILEVIKFF